MCYEVVSSDITRIRMIFFFVLGFRSRGFLLNTLSGGSTFDMVGGWARAGAGWFMGYHITFHFRGTISSQGGMRGSQGEINSQVYCTYVFRFISLLKCITRVTNFQSTRSGFRNFHFLSNFQQIFKFFLSPISLAELPDLGLASTFASNEDSDGCPNIFN